ncbi:MAG: MMPL family transporter [Candidatus Marinimicrobia bacterium]|jgi:hypothetical protein|nr:MMPL family transporter [Candidatus Neomarinimicrobiota bacterium]MBT3758442.1 MMPL family transporter [Candidatus Neomarinimicrobiota bacterium]MBT6215295.1 MMPL family transporter [Candidatus Neomarinimicrobiota bacterium]MBT7882392.1 MMPL family transporter [Candidatus Neomarinimicrobiota bacterium]
MRNYFLEKVALFSVHKTWQMLSGLLLISIFLGYFAGQLEISTSYTEMLPKGNAKALEFELILDEFNNASNIILLAEGDEKELKAFADYLKPRLLGLDHWIDRVDIKIPYEFYRRHGLKLLKSNEMKNFKTVYENPNLIPFLTNLNDSFEREYTGDESIGSKRKEMDAVRLLDGIEIFIDIQQSVMDGKPIDNPGLKAVDAMTVGETYFLSQDKIMIIIMIEPVFNMIDDFAIVVEAVDGIEIVIKEAAEKFNVEAGLTGSLVLGRDEMHAVESDSMRITILALIGIFLLFVISFRMWASPILAIITVCFGVLWALGISNFLVDNLNMSTAMMGVILVGLGIDFSVHIISSYTEQRYSGLDAYSAMLNALTKSGPGIMTGGFTTAAAFFTMMFSENRGMWEMGLLSGFGITTTMLASILILPTLLIARERILSKSKMIYQPRDISYHFLGNIATHIKSNSIPYAIVFLIITIGAGFRASKMEIDYNYLNLEPEGLESIKLQDKLIDGFDLSSDFVLFTSTDINEIEKLTKLGRELPSVGWVESITDYLPEKETSSNIFRFLRDIRNEINTAQLTNEISPLDIIKYQDEIERLQFNIIELQDMAYIGGQDKIYDKAIRLVGEVDDTTYIGNMIKLLNSINSQDVSPQLLYLQNEFSREFKSAVIDMTNTEPLSEESLPAEIRNRFIGKSNEVYLVSVYPKRNIWEDTKFLFQFTADAEKISPKATGLPPIFVELLEVMGRDGYRSTMFAIIAVFILLLVDFRKIIWAFIGMIPLLFGAVWMVGIMEISGLKLNMMNIMAIPLIIGIGIDDGVHILHRYKIERNTGLVYRSTGKAVLLTTLTTMLGFGSLWFATYRGLGSMGISLFIGVGTCFLSTLFIVPMVFGIKEKLFASPGEK